MPTFTSARLTPKTYHAAGTISSANITATTAGALGHANGYVVVPAPGTGKVLELVSAIFVMEYDTAAYTAGGNTTVNLGGGGAALTGLVSNANFIQASADKIIQFVPLAATFLTLTSNTGLALVSASAPTNPGTAAGEIHYRISYRIHDVSTL